MLLTDKTVIITGAARGIGAALAEVCLREGALVIMADREFKERRHASPKGWEIPCDVSRDEDLARLVGSVRRIDGLVNNAGVNFLKPFLDTSLEEFDQVIGIDLRAVFRLTQMVVKTMLKQERPGGSIVNISSVHSMAGVPGAAPYDAAKAGVVGLTRSLAVELAPLGIRVNSISPGLIDTQIWRDALQTRPNPDQYLDYWCSNIPQSRLIDPVEIGELAAFLLSSRASAITGANIAADAGMTSQLVSREVASPGSST